MRQPVQMPPRALHVGLMRHVLAVQSTHCEALPHAVAEAATQLDPLQHCPKPQHDPLQQTVPAAQQVMLLQQTPVPHPPGVQMPCCCEDVSSRVGSSTEQTERTTAATKSQRPARQALNRLRVLESIIESLPRSGN